MRRFAPVVSFLMVVLFTCNLNLFAQVEFTEHVFDNDFPYAKCTLAEDFDRDGDIDIVGTASNGHGFAWWEQDGFLQFTMHEIGEDQYPAPMEIYIIDMDYDSDLDIVSSNLVNDAISWWENDGNMSFTERFVFDDLADPYGIFAIDIDSDCDIDILASYKYDNSVYWFENDGEFNFTSHLICDNFPYANTVYAVDLDGDSDQDILGTGGCSYTRWWENEGNLEFTENLVADSSAMHALDVTAADMDGDSDLDLLVAYGNWRNVQVLENDDNENFTSHTLFTDNNSHNFDCEIVARDLDRDGDVDIVATSRESSEFLWWENLGELEFEQHTIVEAEEISYRSFVSVADLDGDGDNDLITNRETMDGDHIVWWESNVTDFLPPTPAGLISPTDNETIYGGEVTLTWSSSIANDSLGPTDVTYQVEWSIWEDFGYSFDAYAGEDTTVTIGNLADNNTYFWRVVTYDERGNTVFSEQSWCFHIDLTNDVNNQTEALPTSFNVATYPNPFNSELSIDVSLPVNQDLSVGISDLLGRELESWNTGLLNAGTHRFNWTADDYPAGIYFVRIVAQDYNSVQKVLLLK